MREKKRKQRARRAVKKGDEKGYVQWSCCNKEACGACGAVPVREKKKRERRSEGFTERKGKKEKTMQSRRAESNPTFTLPRRGGHQVIPAGARKGAVAILATMAGKKKKVSKGQCRTRKNLRRVLDRPGQFQGCDNEALSLHGRGGSSAGGPQKSGGGLKRRLPGYLDRRGIEMSFLCQRGRIKANKRGSHQKSKGVRRVSTQ